MTAMQSSVKCSLKGAVVVLLFTTTLGSTCCRKTTYYSASKIRDCRCGSLNCMCDLGIFVLDSFLNGIFFVGLDQPMSMKNANFTHEEFSLTYNTYNNKLFHIEKGESITPSCIVNATTSQFSVRGSFPFFNVIGNYHIIRKSFFPVERVGSYNYKFYKNKFAVQFLCTSEKENGKVFFRINDTNFTSIPNSMTTTLNDPMLDTFSSFAESSAHAGIKHTVNAMLSQILQDEMQKRFDNLVNL